jgi:hypothetical protein
MKQNGKWTPEAVEEIRRLWNAGHSCGQIGQMFGVSRNAIIGVTNRNPGFRKKVTRPRNAAPAAPLGLPLVDLSRTQCRYSVTDGSPHLFCGHETVPGKPWCAAHAGRVRAKVQPEPVL